MPVERTSRKPSQRSSAKPTKPNTVKTDIVISIKSEHMENIVSRAKDHEFRKYLINKTIERMWFYVSSPDQALRYIAVISKGKSRGEVETENGIGNAEFNNGLKVSEYAYEILHLYKLRVPLSNVAMKKDYALAVPQRYSYVPEKLFKNVTVDDQEKLF